MQRRTAGVALVFRYIRQQRAPQLRLPQQVFRQGLAAFTAGAQNVQTVAPVFQPVSTVNLILIE
ncbi:hypothetical protein SRABI106_02611 [Rahnella aquatilis]|nr:hypothetical protein SRABI106_02611 [Rahnella aquatilis]